jgi:hypothetical protein
VAGSEFFLSIFGEIHLSLLRSELGERVRMSSSPQLMAIVHQLTGTNGQDTMRGHSFGMGRIRSSARAIRTTMPSLSVDGP